MFCWIKNWANWCGPMYFDHYVSAFLSPTKTKCLNSTSSFFAHQFLQFIIYYYYYFLFSWFFTNFLPTRMARMVIWWHKTLSFLFISFFVSQFYLFAVNCECVNEYLLWTENVCVLIILYIDVRIIVYSMHIWSE